MPSQGWVGRGVGPAPKAPLGEALAGRAPADWAETGDRPPAPRVMGASASATAIPVPPASRTAVRRVVLTINPVPGKSYGPTVSHYY
ncbi:hypothetical protein GCM10009760_60730 [Kitasatospora kazusensis]|uniref:Uncharacterized protein n=1 Tax=Kitasatospora kazusensis TaxID=407974 RepID=A0ABN3ACB5_9ACTN